MIPMVLCNKRTILAKFRALDKYRALKCKNKNWNVVDIWFWSHWNCKTKWMENVYNLFNLILEPVIRLSVNFGNPPWFVFENVRTKKKFCQFGAHISLQLQITRFYVFFPCLLVCHTSVCSQTRNLISLKASTLPPFMATQYFARRR